MNQVVKYIDLFLIVHFCLSVVFSIKSTIDFALTVKKHRTADSEEKSEKLKNILDVFSENFLTLYHMVGNFAYCIFLLMSIYSIANNFVTFKYLRLIFLDVELMFAKRKKP